MRAFKKIRLSCCLLLLLAGFSPALYAAGHEDLVYVGTYTGHGSQGIHGYRFDPATGEATYLGLMAISDNPSFLAADRRGHDLYVVNELEKFQGQPSGGVSAFAIDRDSGQLIFLNEVASRGTDPAYVTLDRSGRFALVANYTSGSVAAFRILKDGRLGEAAAFVQHTGKGFMPGRQDSPHAHMIVPSPNNRFALVADLGLDKIIVYRFNAKTGALTALDSGSASVDAGAGPRHLAFSHDGKFVYEINEMQSTVEVFSFDEHRGNLHVIQKLSTLPADYKGHNDSAEIALHPSGRFLYASNRGHDSIAIYSVDRKTGLLTLLQIVPTQGKTPRNFAIDPSGHWLFAANQKSDDIVIFKIDESTGAITPTDQVLKVSSPVCVTFVPE